MRQALAYYRVSTEDQEKSGLGLDAQQVTVNRVSYIEEITIVKELFEIESGRRNDRVILKKALRYCEKHNIILIFAKVDRFARDALFVASLLISSKVQIIAADKPHATEIDLLEDAIRAQREAETTSQRTKDALAVAKSRGVVLGKAVHELNEKIKKQIEEYTIKMAPVITGLQDEGFKTVRAIMGQLKKRRIPPFRGRQYHWHLTTVYTLLKRIQAMNANNSTTYIDHEPQIKPLIYDHQRTPT
jgi:DNA invertase Pin-like site-specific DNA recombinase